MAKLPMVGNLWPPHELVIPLSLLEVIFFFLGEKVSKILLKEKKQTTKQNKNQIQERSDWKTTYTSSSKSFWSNI